MARPDQEQGVSTAPHRKIIHIDWMRSMRPWNSAIIRQAGRGGRLCGARRHRGLELRSPQIRHSLATPSMTAKRQSRPDLRQARFEIYKAISRQIREIFAEHTPIVEPLSLDEAYLNAPENLSTFSSANPMSCK